MTTTAPNVTLSPTGSASTGQNWSAVRVRTTQDVDITFTASEIPPLTVTKVFKVEPQKIIVPEEGITSEFRIVPDMTFKIKVLYTPENIFTKVPGTVYSPNLVFSDYIDVIGYDGAYTYTLRSKSATAFPNASAKHICQMNYANWISPGNFEFYISDKTGNFS